MLFRIEVYELSNGNVFAVDVSGYALQDTLVKLSVARGDVLISWRAGLYLSTADYGKF